MVSSLALQLKARLEAADVLVELERRGRDPHPGRPDSVIWLRPDTVPVDRVVPLLVELEGARNTTASYHASKRDVEEFAARHDPTERPLEDDFRYHLSWPTLDRAFADAVHEGQRLGDPTATPAPLSLPVEYELFSVPSTTVTGKQVATDADLHRELRQQFRQARRRKTTPQGFTSGATVWTEGDTEIVNWEVHWSLPNANEGDVTVPFVVNAGSTIESALAEEFAPVTVPMMVVLNGSPPALEGTITHETGIRVPTVSTPSITRGTFSDKVK